MESVANAPDDPTVIITVRAVEMTAHFHLNGLQNRSRQNILISEQHQRVNV